MRGLKRLRRVVSSVFELYEYNKPLTLFQVKVVSSQQIQLPTPCEMTICPLVMDFRTHHSRYVAEESGNLRRYFFAVVILDFVPSRAYTLTSSPSLHSPFPAADTISSIPSQLCGMSASDHLSSPMPPTARLPHSSSHRPTMT